MEKQKQKNELGKGMKEKPTQQKIYLSTIPDAVAVAYSWMIRYLCTYYDPRCHPRWDYNNSNDNNNNSTVWQHQQQQ